MILAIKELADTKFEVLLCCCLSILNLFLLTSTTLCYPGFVQGFARYSSIVGLIHSHQKLKISYLNFGNHKV